MPRGRPPIADEARDKVINLLVRGYSVKAIEDETGISKSSIKAIKKELTIDGGSSLTDGIDLVEEGSSSDVDYITKTEKKYIDKLEGELSLFEDADEGWVFHLTAEELKKRTSGIWWSAIMYPTKEDPDGTERIRRLRLLGLEMAVSPLHDKDKTEEGQKKKAHWHLIFKTAKKESYREFNAIIRDITGGPYIKKVLSLKGAYEYFIHLNNPEKYQYDKSEIQEYNGFHLEANKHERALLLASITSEIVENPEIDSYKAICERHLHEEEVMNIISTHSHHIKTLITENWRKNNPDWVREVRITNLDTKEKRR